METSPTTAVAPNSVDVMARVPSTPPILQARFDALSDPSKTSSSVTASSSVPRPSRIWSAPWRRHPRADPPDRSRGPLTPSAMSSSPPLGHVVDAPQGQSA